MGTPHVITLAGEVDIAVVEELSAGVHAGVHAARSDMVVVDVNAVTFIDATGVDLLVSVCRLQQAHGGHVAITGASAMLVLMLQLMGLTQILPVLEPTGDEQGNAQRASQLHAEAHTEQRIEGDTVGFGPRDQAVQDPPVGVA